MTKNEIKNIIGLIIKNARDSNKLTQEELSARININQSNLSNIENGKNFPSFETLCAIVEILNIEPNELLGFLKFKENKKTSLDIELFEYIRNLDNNTKNSLLSIVKKLTK